jgi:hypothetical protein
VKREAFDVDVFHPRIMPFLREIKVREMHHYKFSLGYRSAVRKSSSKN